MTLRFFSPSLWAYRANNLSWNMQFNISQCHAHPSSCCRHATLTWVSAHNGKRRRVSNISSHRCYESKDLRHHWIHIWKTISSQLTFPFHLAIDQTSMRAVCWLGTQCRNSEFTEKYQCSATTPPTFYKRHLYLPINNPLSLINAYLDTKTLYCNSRMCGYVVLEREWHCVLSYSSSCFISESYHVCFIGSTMS